MPLAAGARIGGYEIIAALGAGGMGEVYRARDARLQRDVAIKVLPEAFASDLDRLARFEREAQLLAALNHPHIAQIYGIVEGPAEAGHDNSNVVSGFSQTVRALVMELVDGETLADRMARGPIPLDETLRVARQLADALDAAHQKGIVHRDLKPANIRITRDGVVKVLDFGLAKLNPNAPNDSNAANDPNALSMSPTITSPVYATGVGALMGSAAYMAPEQARAQALDKRADIWAFGVIVYEMLTGAPLFAAATVTDTLAAVVSRTVDTTRVPRRVQRLLTACLARDPRERLRDIADAWRLLDDEAPPAPSERKRTALFVAIGAAVVAALAAILWGRSPAPQPAVSPVSRYEIALPANTGLNLADRPAVAISPDGSALAFIVLDGGTNRLVVRKRNNGEAQLVPGSEGATNPAFSPDGRTLAFFTETSLNKYFDGSITPIANIVAANAMRGLTWLDDTSLIYPAGNADGLVQISIGGGEAKVLSTVDRARGERTHRWPHALPGGKVVLFTVGMQESPDDYDNAVVDALVLATGERRRLLKAANMAVYLPSGHLVFARGGSLYAVRFDVGSLTVSEPAQLILQDVAGDRTTGAAHFSVAADGTLAYAAGAGTVVGRRLVWADRRGNLETLPLPAGAYGDPQLSPDGSRLAITLETSTARDIWLYTFTTNAFTRFTFGGRNWTPAWSADSKTIFYVTSEAGVRTILQRKPADGSAAAEQLAEVDGEAYLNSVTDRAAILGFRNPKNNQLSGKFEAVAVDLAAPHAMTTLITRSIVGGVVSPNGRFLAYGSDESGRPEIYVTDFPGLRGRWQVTTEGGEEPHWSPNGDQLFMRYNDQFMVARVDKAGAFQASAPVLLFKGVYNVRPVTMLSFSVDPKRDRFLMLRPAQEDTGATQLRIVLNWVQELGRRVPAP